MFRYFPISILLLAVAGIAAAVPLIPGFGFFLIILSMLPVMGGLVNAAMIGMVVETVLGRTSRWWLIVPITFYGGYATFVVKDRIEFRSMATEVAAANASVSIPFDPRQQALVLDIGVQEPWLERNFALPVVYLARPALAEGHLSLRMMDRSICARIQKKPLLMDVHIRASNIYVPGVVNRTIKPRFCEVTMPEAPALPIVRAAMIHGMPLSAMNSYERSALIVHMPEGQQFRLQRGRVALLPWLPNPSLICASHTDCKLMFRSRFPTSLISKEGEARGLARALGLRVPTVEERRGADPALVLRRVSEAESVNASGRGAR